MSEAVREVEVVVVGAGPAGLAAAVALASAGVETALVAPAARPDDWRTSALLAGSVEFLRSIAAWDRLAPFAAPLRRIRLVDDTARLFRGPEIVFDAAEIGLPTFGWNVPNRDLVRELEALGAGLPRLARVLASAERIAFEADAGIVATEAGTLRARLVVGADGRGSAVRQAAGIGTRTWSYDQAALVTNFSHTAPHDDVSTEFHGPAGPFTVVPLAPGRSSLVWVERPGRAEALRELPEAELAREIERRSHAIVGAVTIDAPRQVFPLSGLTAHRTALGRAALVGEAAHALPPIGAQGLNLGLRDVAALAEIVSRRPSGTDPGAAAVTEAYERRRRADVTLRTAGVDLLNRSLLSDLLPVQLVRAAGLEALRLAAPLRRLLMREGTLPGTALPALVGGLLPRGERERRRLRSGARFG